MDNDAIIVEHSLAEQHSYINNQKLENSAQNQSNSEEIVKMINKQNRSSISSTLLYKSFYSSQSS